MNRSLGLGLARGLLLAACAAAGPPSDMQLERVWEDTGIWVKPPDSRSMRLRTSDSMVNTLAGRLDPGQKLPVIVYLHGCDGADVGNPQRYSSAGYVVVVPNSFARGPHRYKDCAIGADKKQVIVWRFEEATSTVEHLLKITWVDSQRLILMGHSEGGVATALYPGKEFRARIILGWSCTSSNPWHDGIRGRRDDPILAIIGDADHYLQNPSNRGHCGTRFGNHPSSESILLPGVGHNMNGEAVTVQKITEFLKLQTTPE